MQLLLPFIIGAILSDGDAVDKRQRERRQRLSVLEAMLQALWATSPDLPVPTAFLDDGMSGGAVFETDDPWVIVKILSREAGSDFEREMLFLDEDLAETRGLVYVRGAVFSPTHLAIWKQRVTPWVESLLYRKYDDKRAHELMWALSGLYSGEQLPAKLKVLDSAPETRDLARAIRRGAPTTDLDLHQNLGVTRDDRIVAFDL